MDSVNSVQPATSGRQYLLRDTFPIAARETGAVSDLDQEKARLRQATRDFEAIFMRQLMAAMQQSLENGGMFGEGVSGGIYSDFMNSAIADKVSERGGIGLADALYRRIVVRIDPDAGIPR